MHRVAICRNLISTFKLSNCTLSYTSDIILLSSIPSLPSQLVPSSIFTPIPYRQPVQHHTTLLTPTPGLRQQSLPPRRHNWHRKYPTRWPHGDHGRRAAARRPAPHAALSLAVRSRGLLHQHHHRPLYRHLYGQRHQAPFEDQQGRGALLPNEDWG